MNIGIVLPGFSSDAYDMAIPVQLNLARELAARDSVRVLALRYPHRRDQYQIDDVTVISLGYGQGRGLQRLSLWQDAILTLRRLHHETPFDALHAMWADETGLIANWAGRLLNVPTVVSVLGGELTRLDDIDYGLQRGAFSRWIVGQALTGADCIIAAGDYVRVSIAEAGYRVAESRIRVLPLGVDTTLFHPADMLHEPRHLLHVGSLISVKAQAVLLRALARLDGDVTLDIIGEGPDHARLVTLAASLGVTERVCFVGKVNHADLPAYYQRAALHILTSRSEALPIVALEAAACGTPTVCTAVGALPEYPDIAVTVTVGDDAALAMAIRRLLDQPAELAERRTRALQAARERFDIRQTASQLRAVYLSLQAR